MRAKQRFSTLVIVRHQCPDQFFTVEQQSRLKKLMARWRVARDRGAALVPPEQAELDALVEVEVRAAGQRTAEVLRKLAQ